MISFRQFYCQIFLRQLFNVVTVIKRLSEITRYFDSFVYKYVKAAMLNEFSEGLLLFEIELASIMANSLCFINP